MAAIQQPPRRRPPCMRVAVAPAVGGRVCAGCTFTPAGVSRAVGEGCATRHIHADDVRQCRGVFWIAVRGVGGRCVVSSDEPVYEQREKQGAIGNSQVLLDVSTDTE